MNFWEGLFLGWFISNNNNNGCLGCGCILPIIGLITTGGIIFFSLVV
jgi:hypothetical protein